ncbi:alpha/beta fold hydrolase [Schlesneria sp. T3-172]|uniref:SGNH/GDSL hydrolase family protein n=1 Tax=Schlesneria sphaerica TaxID=3373610 RepID=UPI0037C944F1
MRRIPCLRVYQTSVGFGIIVLTMGLLGHHRMSVAAEGVKELGPPVDVSFIARLDGTEQRYVIQKPRDSREDQPYSLLIALHGHGSDRWQFVNDGRGECRAARDAAAQHQMIYVSPDYRARTSWMGPAAEADMLQIIDDLHQQFRIEKVIVSGGSMGGTSAMIFAALHPEVVDGAVSLNGTSNMAEYEGFPKEIAESYGGTKADVPAVYRARSAELFPERLTMPVSFTTGGRDTLVPPDSTLRLAAAMKDRGAPVNLLHRPEGGHDSSYEDSLQAFEYVINKALAVPELTPRITLKEGPVKVVCLGDSVTGVYYHTGGRRAYPEMLEVGLRKILSREDITVINAGISGNTTQDGLNRLDTDVLAHHPQIVTISFGLNDVTRIPLETFRANLELLTKRCRDAGSEVILCTPNSVITTASRPIEKLLTYCDTIRAVGREMNAPVCDQHLSGTKLLRRAPWTWRLTLSDEIHPNMAGHKRMAEELCRTITGKGVSLDQVGPLHPSLPRLASLLKEDRPIKVLAMAPYNELIGNAIKNLKPTAQVEVSGWEPKGKSIAALEAESKALVRNLKPDLVLLAVPRSASAKVDEEFVRNFSWIMNWALSFAHQEWDCIVIHPSVADPDSKGSTDETYRQLVHAQDLGLIDRKPDDRATAAELLSNGIKQAVE